MKYLIVFAVVFIAIYLWRKGRRDELRSRPPPPAAPRQVPPPESMTRCAHCGLHLPQADAIAGPDGSYCSQAHRQAGAR
ncbi:conserved hypothetical protein [Burkholderiales bacterium 8X]|nr:conserved hypothetical protein [Burkholderiales bacterium 8X]